MPRANRHFQPGYVYHITHRCHQRHFNLKTHIEKRRYRYWLWLAVHRYQLIVLNYIITNNHIHLLVLDTGFETISKSMQLVAGQTAREYVERKHLETGAFWQGRYYATAVECNQHLLKCMLYIDLNMVRAGLVAHPIEWQHGGYTEYCIPKLRYRILDFSTFLKLTGYKTIRDYLNVHNEMIHRSIEQRSLEREPLWTESNAVGSTTFIERFK